jgi:hypothetical protein
LRDGANSQWSLMDQLEASVADTSRTLDREGETPAPTASAPAARQVPASVVTVVVAQQIDWNARPRTDINVGDLTAKIAALLNRRK